MPKEILIKTLLDIAEAIVKINNSFVKIASAEDFLIDQENIDRLDAISMRLHAIGEALKKVIKEFPGTFEKYTEIDWKGIINFRDKISHHYFDIDSEEIYEICKNDIPKLEKVINKIISDLEKQ